jgi:hypothetical protein
MWRRSFEGPSGLNPLILVDAIAGMAIIYLYPVLYI